MRFSVAEIREIAKAWALVSIAFAIYSSGGFLLFSNPAPVLILLAISLATVGIGFVFHELAHKVVAQRYGFFAEFRANDQMLFMSLLLAFVGVFFAAPGGVFFHGGMGISKEKIGKISLAGPLSTVVIALIFYTMAFAIPVRALAPFLRLGFVINAWLGLFNLIPFPGFDGSKVLAWNKPVYFTSAAFAGALVLLSFAAA